MEGKENVFELVESQDALDSVPTWQVEVWWFVVAAGALLVIFGLVMILRKKVLVDGSPHLKDEAYRNARAGFQEVPQGSVREEAVSVSMILRRYLADSMGEPALYETHEEFVGRHDGLKGLPVVLRSDVGSFFSQLAAWKYAPEEAVVEGMMPREQGLGLLERIHKA